VVDVKKKWIKELLVVVSVITSWKNVTGPCGSQRLCKQVFPRLGPSPIVDTFKFEDELRSGMLGAAVSCQEPSMVPLHLHVKYGFRKRAFRITSCGYCGN
jgi:hypothetical protein